MQILADELLSTNKVISVIRPGSLTVFIGITTGILGGMQRTFAQICQKHFYATNFPIQNFCSCWYIPRDKNWKFGTSNLVLKSTEESALGCARILNRSRPVTSLGHQRGRRVLGGAQNFFELSNTFSRGGGAKYFYGDFSLLRLPSYGPGQKPACSMLRASASEVWNSIHIPDVAASRHVVETETWKFVDYAEIFTKTF